MNERATKHAPRAQGYDAYLAEGASLLACICEGAHIALLGGRLFIVTEIVPAMADALCNWGADLSDLEPEDTL